MGPCWCTWTHINPINGPHEPGTRTQGPRPGDPDWSGYMELFPSPSNTLQATRKDKTRKTNVAAEFRAKMKTILQCLRLDS